MANRRSSTLQLRQLDTSFWMASTLSVPVMLSAAVLSSLFLEMAFVGAGAAARLIAVAIVGLSLAGLSVWLVRKPIWDAKRYCGGEPDRCGVRSHRCCEYRMNRDIKWGDLFGPESLLGVVLGTTYLMLIVLRIVDISIGFGALVIIGIPLAITAGLLKRLGVGLIVSLAALPLTVLAFLIAIGIGSTISGSV